MLGMSSLTFAMEFESWFIENGLRKIHLETKALKFVTEVFSQLCHEFNHSWHDLCPWRTAQKCTKVCKVHQIVCGQVKHKYIQLFFFFFFF